MTADTTRDDLQQCIDAFLAGWSTGHWNGAHPAMAAGTRLVSSVHGEASGADAIALLLGGDSKAQALQLRTSNHYVGASGDVAVASLYAIASVAMGARSLVVGTTLVFTFRHDGQAWQFDEIRLAANWLRGDARLMPHWVRTPDNNGWKLGDPPPSIVSELDSPWARLPCSTLAATHQQALRELYSRYSFAIDQGDIALLADSFSEDARGGFSPMGQLHGRHQIIGQMKSFRRHWPWMQHFADVPVVEVDADGTRGRMIVARIIPERQQAPGIGMIYGAHYQIEAVKGDDGRWRIQWTDYRPGWFAHSSVPAFDIGTSDA